MKTTEQIKHAFRENQLDSTLKKLYFGEHCTEIQRIRYINALEKFEKLYGVKEAEIYSAPGRTEIGGNHTDHQNGKVLAASIDLDAIAVAAKTEDGIVRIKSEGYQPFADRKSVV